MYCYIVHLQKFESDDYRLARFVDKKKHVNQQFAINLVDEVPPAPRKERVVWCDGGGGPTGHPKVYINLVSIIKCSLIEYFQCVNIYKLIIKYKNMLAG